MKNKTCKKGIILAGGHGTRLYPMTTATNKQLLPIYDKPIIYYPLSTLMFADIKEILIISTVKDIAILNCLLGDGRQWGISIDYAIQEEPKGLPEAFLIGERFINKEPVALILGDNFFHGHGLSSKLYYLSNNFTSGAHLFCYQVKDPHRYGIMVLDENGNAIDIEEKPKKPKSKLAVTGLYFYDETVTDRAKSLKPSARGELEITDLNNTYLNDKKISVHQLNRGYVWFDVGTPSALSMASSYVQVVQERQSISIACPEEIALRMGFINKKQFIKLYNDLPKNEYSQYLKDLFETF